MIFEHKSVLLYETVDSLNIKPDGIYVDGTLGGGGHVQDAAALAEALKNMMADGGAPWRLLHENLLKADMTGGSGKIADLALNLAAERTN